MDKQEGIKNKCISLFNSGLRILIASLSDIIFFSLKLTPWVSMTCEVGMRSWYTRLVG